MLKIKALAHQKEFRYTRLNKIAPFLCSKLPPDGKSPHLIFWSCICLINMNIEYVLRSDLVSCNMKNVNFIWKNVKKQ